MKASEFMQRVHATYKEYQETLAGLNEAQILQADVVGPWSVKDVIAHVTWFEKEMVDLLQSRVLEGSELWLLPTDQRNEAIFHENKDRSLAAILAEEKQVHSALMPLLEALTDEDLMNPSRFREMPSDWLPWELIAGSTSGHYEEHVRDIRAEFPPGVK